MSAMMRIAADQPNRCTGNLHRLLPEILARKQAEQGFWRIFQAMYNVLPVYEAAVPMAPVRCLDGFGTGDLPIALTSRGSKGGRKDLLVVIRGPYRPLKRRVACA
jgi:hypothetical protein